MKLTVFRELWIHTGTACNLSCPFCHEASSPGDTRLVAPSLLQAQVIIKEALENGVQRFAFTGGEPLIHREILAILKFALQHRPCLVLTNGTAPFIRRPQGLIELAQLPQALSFRVSIDWPDEALHDAARGYRNFRKAIEGLKLLHAAGFAVGVTRMSRPDEDPAAVTARFQKLFRKSGLPEDLSIVALPELLPFAAHAPPPATAAPATPQDKGLICSTGRMALWRPNGLRVAPCPLVNDDESMETPGLTAALGSHPGLKHRRCQICLTQSVDYARFP